MQIVKWMAMIAVAASLTAMSFDVAAQKCPARNQFKGIELYSWQDARGWKFALVPGTNRPKPAGEIKGQGCVIGTDQLTAEIARLGDKQSIFWFHKNITGFTYPPDEVIEKIVTAAKQAGTEMNGPPRESDAATPVALKQCKDKQGDLNRRHAELSLNKQQMDSKTAVMDRESAELAAQLRNVQGANQSHVDAHNARSAEHNRRVKEHNDNVLALRQRMDTLNIEMTAFESECSSQGLKLPKLEPVPGK
jgi:hypothetical protein